MISKKWIIGFSLSAVLAAFILLYSVSGMLTEWILVSEINSHLGVSLHYEEITFNDKGLTFHKVTLGDEEKAKAKEGSGEDYRFEAERLEILYAFHLLGRQIEAEVSIINPVLQIDRKSQKLPSWKRIRTTESPLFHVKACTWIEGGRIVFYEQEKPTETLYVDGEIDWQEHLRGTAVIAFDEKKGENNTLSIDFDQNVLETTADLIVKGVDCSRFGAMAQYFWREFDSHWECHQGTLEGRMVAVFPHSHEANSDPDQDPAPVFDGDLRLFNLQLSNNRFAIKSTIGEGRLRLNGLSPRFQGTHAPMILGEFDIVEDAAATLFRDGDRLWKVQNLLGHVLLDDTGEIHLAFDGLSFEGEDPRRLHIDGVVTHLDTADCGVQLDGKLASNGQPDVEIGLRWQWGDDSKRTLHVDWKNVGSSECDVADALLKVAYPSWPSIRILSGNTSGSVQVYNAEELTVREFSSANIALDLPGWGLQGSCDQMQGQGVFHFSEDHPFQTTNTDFTLHNGSVRFVGPNQHPCEFANIEADVKIRQGRVEHSSIHGVLAGLQGQVQLNWSETDEIAQLMLSGTAQDAITLLPDEMQGKIEQNFGDDRIEMTAGVSLADRGLLISGDLFVGQECIRFGCKLERQRQKQKRGEVTSSASSALDPISHSKRRQLEMLALHHLTPRAAAPSAVLTTGWLQESPEFYGITVYNGWFEAEDLPLQRYVAPFVFDEGSSLRLTGTGGIQGTFDHHSFALHYGASDLTLESPHLAIRVDALGSLEDRAKQKKYPAVHFFDLKEHTHFGFIPVHNAVYEDKNHNLKFEKLDAEVIIEGKKVHVSHIETEADGVAFAGRVDLDYTNDRHEEFDVSIYTNKIDGEIQQVKSFLSHFDTLFLQESALEGRLVSANQEGYLYLGFRPGPNLIEGYLEGTLLDGTMNSANGRLGISDLSLNFSYHSKENALHFADVGGKLRLGQEEDGEFYTITSRQTRIWDFPHNKLDFDIRIEDDTRDLIRIVGQGESKKEKSKEGIIQLSLNPEYTHLGQIRPNITQLALKDWSEVVAFKAEPVVSLSAFVDDLQRLSKTGALYVSSEEIDVLKDMKLDGQLKGEIEYDPLNKAYSFNAVGEDVITGKNSKSFETVFINGKKSGDKWSIEQLQVDEISIAGDFIQKPQEWDIDFMGLRYGTTFLMGLEGRYQAASNRLDAAVNLLEIDLEKMQELEGLEEFAAHLNPKGLIKGTGNIAIAFGSAEESIRVEVDIEATSSDLELGEVRLENTTPISCHYDSDSGVVVKDVQATITAVRGQPANLALQLSRMQHSLELKETHLQGLRFRLPAKDLDWVARLFQETFPEQANHMMVDTIRGLKKEEDLVGSADINLSSKDQSIRLALDQGVYTFSDGSHELKDFLLEYDPYELKISSQYRFHDQYYWFSLRTSALALNYGQVVLADRHPDELESEEQPLILFWDWDPTLGFLVRRAEGHFSGLEVHLNQSDQPALPGTLSMTGQVHVDAQELSKLFGPGIARIIREGKIGDGYELSGAFTFDKTHIDCIGFKGALLGRDCALMGYRFKTLHAEVDLAENGLRVQDFMIVDGGGNFRMDSAQIEKKGEMEGQDWDLSIPLVLCENVRPSLLTSVEGEMAEEKPLTIQRLEMREVTGTLGRLDTITGAGILSFINPSKHNLRNTILAIPADILSRIGIGVDLLTPVTGTIYYDIHDGRIYLTEFKDIYSEGRVSKFYLPSNYASSIDFSGNLDVHIRMKQYNLLFKLAELFTISVNGTLVEPDYSLKKKSVAEVESEEGVEGKGGHL